MARLRDRYTIGRELGRGTFGTVYLGRCLQSGKPVAIKRVSLLFAREAVREEVSDAVRAATRRVREARDDREAAMLDAHKEAFAYGIGGTSTKAEGSR